MDGQFKRKNTRQSVWAEAKAVGARWSDSGSWAEGGPPVSQQTMTQSERTHDPAALTINRAVVAFLAEHAQSSAPNTLKKYRAILRKLTAYAEWKGYVVIEQLKPIDVREFRQSWTVSPLTASKNMSVVKTFFEFAVANEWIDRNPARMLRAPRGQAASHGRERPPFSDEELRRMFHACRTLYGREAAHRYRWTGRDLEDFISVSLYTGLRISDVCTFHIDRLLPSGECHIRTTKNARKVFTWAPEWLQQRLRRRAKRIGPLIFGEHVTIDINVITDVWRRKLNRLWVLCGPWKEKPMPHRFRHTFVRILLERSGVTVRDVAELLGDTGTCQRL